MKKTIALVLAAALAFTILSGCGSKTEYRDDVDVAALAEAVMECIASSDELAVMNEAYISGLMQMKTEGYSGCCVYISPVGTNIDEFGIFKAGSASTAEAEQEIKAYLQMREETWMKEYIPEEHPKLENAEIQVCGSYVIYLILSDAERAEAIKAFKTALEK